jgi:hypothetical protein
MSEDKNKDLPRFGAADDSRGNLASRARNRTVLLTPDTIGQVRAGMPQEEEPASLQDPMNELMPPVSWDYQQPQQQAPLAPPAPEEGFSAISRTLDDERREMAAPVNRSTGKFQSAIGPGSRTAMAQTTVIPSPVSASGFSPARPQKGSTATDIKPPAKAESYVAPAVKQAPKSKIVGFLIGFDTEPNGEVFEIRAGRFLVTSRPTDHGEYLLIDDETISPLHAIIRATTEGKVQVLDQLSEYGTGIFRAGSEAEEDVAGTMAAVGHGDIIRFGKREFVVCLVPRVQD